MADISATALQLAAERILVRHLRRGTVRKVSPVGPYELEAGLGVDIVLTLGSGEQRGIKVKADPYFGTDAEKIRDRILSYYRADTGDCAFEALANGATREPGWMVESQADDLYYYYVALAQEPEEVSALLEEGDSIFFSELRVERDELLILPMSETREWFTTHAEKFPPRPVFAGSTPSWYRLVPRSVVLAEIRGARIVGAVYPDVAL